MARSAMMLAPAVTVNSADSSAEASGVAPLIVSTFAQTLVRLLAGKRVGLGEHLARAEQVPRFHGHRRRGRILQQIEQVESADRRALREVPLARRAHDAGLGMAGVRGLVPRHRAVDADGRAGPHRGRELVGGSRTVLANPRLLVQLHRLALERLQREGRDRHRGARRQLVREFARDDHVARVGQRDARVEVQPRGLGRAFREVAGERPKHGVAIAALVRAFLVVGPAIAVRIGVGRAGVAARDRGRTTRPRRCTRAA